MTYTASGSKTYGSTTDNSTASGFIGFKNGENAPGRRRASGPSLHQRHRRGGDGGCGDLRDRLRGGLGDQLHAGGGDLLECVHGDQGDADVYRERQQGVRLDDG